MLNNSKEEIKAIRNALSLAQKFDLEIEVLWSAFKAIQQTPELTIEEALHEGLNEWDL